MLTPFLLSWGARAAAFTPNYNPADMIDNGTFANNSAMTASTIQSFLSNVGSGLANVEDVEACSNGMNQYYPHCGQTLPASQLIYDAAQAYGLNPEVILATLEKEQSLVTQPAPDLSDITAVNAYDGSLSCAMGYGSCKEGSSTLGFFNQVDNGAYTLAYNYQAALGTTSWLGVDPSGSYACGTSHPGYYVPGLLPGNTVTFADPTGTAETITLANAATASLYCYTPYVGSTPYTGPYYGTGYTGSYNFVYYFQLWFGSTQASEPFAWVDEGQNAYTDSGYSQAYPGGQIYVAPGQNAYLSVDARNVGYNTWWPSVVHLGTSHPDDRASVFYDSSAGSNWLSANRIAMQQSSVEPGQDATFNFAITAPSTPGTYKEYFNVVADGVSWLNDNGLFFTINVVQPNNVSNSPTLVPGTSGQSITPGQYLLSPDKQTALYFSPSGAVDLYSDGALTWSNGVNNSSASQLTMQADGNLVEYASGTALWASNTGGNSQAYLELQTDGNAVIYSATNTPLWASSTGINPPYTERVDQTLSNGAMLFPGQSLQTVNKSDTLLLQTDGNLVEYSASGTALWASNTGGQTVGYMVMQSDGNMVLYTPNGKAMWASDTGGMGSGLNLAINPSGVTYINTSGGDLLFPSDKIYGGESVPTSSGYSFNMQTDGNLVLYDPNGKAIWATNTGGSGGAYAYMQPNGSLVLYSSSGKTLWTSNTTSNGPLKFVVQNDGNLVLYNDANSPIWAANTTGL